MRLDFSQPWWFLLFLVLIPLVVLYKKKRVAIQYPSIQLFKGVQVSRWQWLRHVGFVCRLAALSFFILALARPQSGREQYKHKSEGLDIMLVLDTSISMRAMDFTIKGKRRDRLYVVKQVVGEFITKRYDDRIGMVVFGTHAFAQSPLTLDHDVLLTYLSGVEIGMAGEATALGDALGVAINRIKDLQTKDKVIIMLTDGENTAGKLDPIEVAKIAKVLGVRIYTIGVGSDGLVPVPSPFGYQQAQVSLDEKTLREISKITEGQYFRASSTEALLKVYNTIDTLEKTEKEIEVFRNYEERYSLFLWPGLFFLVLELLMGMTRFRRVP